MPLDRRALRSSLQCARTYSSDSTSVAGAAMPTMLAGSLDGRSPHSSTLVGASVDASDPLCHFTHQLSEATLQDLEEWIQCVVNTLQPPVSEKVELEECLAALRSEVQNAFPRVGAWHAAAFGSSANGFGAQGCDFDVVVHELGEVVHFSAAVVQKLNKHFRTRQCEFAVVQSIPTANVPILRLRFRDRHDVDLSINNTHPLRNTRLLRTYADMDGRVRALGLVVKHWAKMHSLCGASKRHLSSYAFVLMCIYFLHNDEGIKLPCLQRDGDAPFEDDAAAVAVGVAARTRWQLQLPLILLTMRFFHFYSKCFRWGSEVVSIRAGCRKDANDAYFASLPHYSENRIHIEDPFQLSRNLNCQLAVDNEKRLHKSLQRTWSGLSQGKRDALFIAEHLPNEEHAALCEDPRINELLGRLRVVVESQSSDGTAKLLAGSKKENMLRWACGIFFQTGAWPGKEDVHIRFKGRPHNKEISRWIASLAVHARLGCASQSNVSDEPSMALVTLEDCNNFVQIGVTSDLHTKNAVASDGQHQHGLSFGALGLPSNQSHPVTTVERALTVTEKNVLKSLKVVHAIQKLEVRQAAGGKLDKTQEFKILRKAEALQELADLVEFLPEGSELREKYKDLLVGS